MSIESNDLRFKVNFRNFVIHLADGKDVKIQAYSYTETKDHKSIMFWMPAKGLPFLVKEGGKIDPHHWDCVGCYQLDNILGFTEVE